MNVLQMLTSKIMHIFWVNTAQALKAIQLHRLSEIEMFYLNCLKLNVYIKIFSEFLGGEMHPK